MSWDSHQHSWKLVVPSNIYSINLNYNGSLTNIHKSQWKLASFVLLLLVEEVMLRVVILYVDFLR